MTFCAESGQSDSVSSDELMQRNLKETLNLLRVMIVENWNVLYCIL